jgi:hypothetical protein
MCQRIPRRAVRYTVVRRTIMLLRARTLMRRMGFLLARAPANFLVSPISKRGWRSSRFRNARKYAVIV